MELFTDISAKVAAIRDLIGEVPDAAGLPSVVDRLDNAGALELLELVSAVGHMTERLRVAAAGVVARRSSRDAGHSGLAQSRGHRNAVALVQEITGSNRSEASRQVRVGESLYDTAEAASLTPDDTSTGATSTAPIPWHAPLRTALLNGTISAAQHDAIQRGLGQPPEHDSAEVSAEYVSAWSVAAEHLIAEEGRRTVEELAKAARFLRDQLDPEGVEKRYQERHEARSFRMWTDAEGCVRGSLVFDDLSAAWARSMLDAGLRPRRGGPRFVDPEAQAQAAALVADPRSNDQLAFDLFMDILRAGSLADAESVYGARQAGVRLVQVVQDADAGKPETTGPAYTEDGVQALPAWVARQQGCNVGTVVVSVDRSGNPLNLGRTVRLFTPAQRIALAVRDGGCRWKGCDRPASYCEAHHIDSWAGGEGRTDIDRGILLCSFHHMQLHNGRWRITRTETENFVLHDPGGGQTELPPRLELRYAWAGIDPPPRRFTLAARQRTCRQSRKTGEGLRQERSGRARFPTGRGSSVDRAMSDPTPTL